MRERISAPRASARSRKPSSSIRSSTARPAAQATGLPGKVPPIPLSGGASMISARPSTPESGRPPAIDLATVMRSGSTPKRSIANRRAGAAEAGLHLVGDHNDAVLVADRAQSAHELGRRHDEAALALDRLEHDRRHLFCGARAARSARSSSAQRLRRPSGSPVRVRERDAVDLGRERPEARPCTGASWTSSDIAISVRPWNPPSKAITAGRRVYARAILTAFSIASAPELKNAARTWPGDRREAREALRELRRSSRRAAP